MNNSLKIGLTFVAGIVVGSIATKLYIDYKNNKEYEYEDEEYDEADNGIDDDEYNEEPQSKVNKLKVDRSSNRTNYNAITNSIEKDQADYDIMLSNLGYRSPDESDLAPIESEFDISHINRDRPYNIPPDEFMALDGYESDDYTYYADGYVTDSEGMPVSAENIESLFGFGFESFFGSYSDDEIWIRNERLKMDFSVARDIDRFVDVATPRIRRMAGLS